MKRFFVVLLIGLLFFGIFGCDGKEKEIRGTSSVSNIVQSQYTLTPPVIDGVLNPTEWPKPAFRKQLRYVNQGVQEEHEMIGYFMNDDSFLYIAIVITDEDFEAETVARPDVDVVEIYFDGNNNGIIESNEDIRNFWNFQYGDWHFEDKTWRSDKIVNGEGKVAYIDGDYIYEFKIPLRSGDIQDLSTVSGSTVGIKILYREMKYNQSEEKWQWKKDGEAEDGWPSKDKEWRFDGSTYGKLILEKSSPIFVDLKQQLAEKFAPILWLHPEEVYEPKDVRIMIENADLRMKEWMTRIPFNRPLTPLDLYTVPDSENLYLDIKDISLIEFEGREFQGAWAYAQKYREIAARYPTTVYSRVTTFNGKTIIQYWFFYFFNDGPFNHEGDWEMVQLVFDGTDLQKILNTTQTPEVAVYSQHWRNFRYDWSAIRKSKTHPHVYVAKGSHAHYSEADFFEIKRPEEGIIEWTDETNAFGEKLVPKDLVGPFAKTYGPENVIGYELVLLPEEAPIIKEVPWLAFKGLWGEWWPQPVRLMLRPGPTGPAVKEMWKNPLTNP